jgi:hypothetical protein
MIVNIITDDFENFYDIQEDIGRLVNYFLFLFSLLFTLHR